jgi:hypothetical protein
MLRSHHVLTSRMPAQLSVKHVSKLGPALAVSAHVCMVYCDVDPEPTPASLGISMCLCVGVVNS